MKYIALETDIVRSWQNGGLDANQMAPEKTLSDGDGVPCRHCLRDIPAGEGMLILAHRPFDTLHPYAETGPIFVCADACTRGGGHDLPAILTTSPDYLVKGYNIDDRIVYGTGAIVTKDTLHAHCERLLQRHDLAYLHIRSARNNCYQLRVER